MLIPNCCLHLKLLYTTGIISCIMFLNGCAFVFSSTLLPELRSPSSPIQIDDEEASWIASIPYLVCPIGLFVTGTLTDNIGRRKALQIAFIPICASWIILAYANSAFMIIIGRFFMGISAGVMPFVVLYLAEVCPTEHRPLYTSIVNTFVGCGMLFENLLSLFFDYHATGAILAALSVASCILLLLLPEPPMWLRSRGRVSEAEAAEKWFGFEPPATAVAVPRPVTATDVGNGAPPVAVPSSCWSVYAHPTVWKPALIMFAFFVCQQGCGFYVLLLYSVEVLRGSTLSLDPVVTVYLSAARVVGGLLFTLAHSARRRTLTTVSSLGMAASIAVFIGYLKWYAAVDDPPYSGIVVVAFVLYVFFSLIGVMPLPWILSSEVFPMAIKGKMCAIVNIFGYELIFLTIKIFPAVSSTVGMVNIWSIFAGFCIITALFGTFIMPETKGKSLDDIIKSFESKKSYTKNNL